MAVMTSSWGAPAVCSNRPSRASLLGRLKACLFALLTTKRIGSKLKMKMPVATVRGVKQPASFVPDHLRPVVAASAVAAVAAAAFRAMAHS